jgi:anaerobic selenocysteine-containing dehydrogenase
MRRRDAIKGMAAGVAATLVGAGGARAAEAADAGVAPAIVSSEHWAKKGDV